MLLTWGTRPDRRPLARADGSRTADSSNAADASSEALPDGDSMLGDPRPPPACERVSAIPLAGLTLRSPEGSTDAVFSSRPSQNLKTLNFV